MRRGIVRGYIATGVGTVRPSQPLKLTERADKGDRAEKAGEFAAGSTTRRWMGQG